MSADGGLFELQLHQRGMLRPLRSAELSDGTLRFLLWGAALLTLAAAVTRLLAAALVCLWLWRWFQRRLQGFTGDCLGATQQLCEVVFYLGLVLAL